MRKAEIYNNLLRYFFEQEISEDSMLEFLEEIGVGNKFNEQLAMRKLEIEERQKDREIEERQRNMEIEERQREKDGEFEFELNKIEIERQRNRVRFKK